MGLLMTQFRNQSLGLTPPKSTGTPESELAYVEHLMARLDRLFTDLVNAKEGDASAHVLAQIQLIRDNLITPNCVAMHPSVLEEQNRTNGPRGSRSSR